MQCPQGAAGGHHQESGVSPREGTRNVGSLWATGLACVPTGEGQTHTQGAHFHTQKVTSACTLHTWPQCRRLRGYLHDC